MCTSWGWGLMGAAWPRPGTRGETQASAVRPPCPDELSWTYWTSSAARGELTPKTEQLLSGLISSPNAGWNRRWGLSWIWLWLWRVGRGRGILNHFHPGIYLSEKWVRSLTSQPRRWSRRKPNCYGWRQQNKIQLTNNRGILKPSWALVETKSEPFLP